MEKEENEDAYDDKALLAEVWAAVVTGTRTDRDAEEEEATLVVAELTLISWLSPVWRTVGAA